MQRFRNYINQLKMNEYYELTIKQKKQISEHLRNEYEDINDKFLKDKKIKELEN